MKYEYNYTYLYKFSLWKFFVYICNQCLLLYEMRISHIHEGKWNSLDKPSRILLSYIRILANINRQLFITKIPWYMYMFRVYFQYFDVGIYLPIFDMWQFRYSDVFEIATWIRNNSVNKLLKQLLKPKISSGL